MIGEKLREYSELLEKETEEFTTLKSTVGKKIDKDKFQINLAEKNRDAVLEKLFRVKSKSTLQMPD